jgi:hypothetical protein
MVEFAKDPPTSEGLLTKFDLRDARCWPELALAMREDGTPELWPGWHPNLERKLTAEERYRWFMEILTDDLRSLTEILLAADVPLRRQIIARSLIELQTTFEIESGPAPDFIDLRDTTTMSNVAPCPNSPNPPPDEPSDPSDFEDKTVADAIEQAWREMNGKRQHAVTPPPSEPPTPEEPPMPELSRFGRMYRATIQETEPERVERLRQSGTWRSHLHEVDVRAQARYEHLVADMQRQQAPLPHGYFERMGALTAIARTAEEIVTRELLEPLAKDAPENPPKPLRIGGRPGAARVRRNPDGSIIYLPGEE